MKKRITRKQEQYKNLIFLDYIWNCPNFLPKHLMKSESWLIILSLTPVPSPSTLESPLSPTTDRFLSIFFLVTSAILDIKGCRRYLGDQTNSSFCPQFPQTVIHGGRVFLSVGRVADFVQTQQPSPGIRSADWVKLHMARKSSPNKLSIRNLFVSFFLCYTVSHDLRKIIESKRSKNWENIISQFYKNNAC